MINIGHVATLIIFGLSACSLQQPTADEKFAQQALQAVRNSMKDPTSVKFKDITVVAPARCAFGEALGKNSFGAYAGYQKFVYSDGAVVFDDPASITDFTRSPEESLKYMNKQSDCATSSMETLADHVLHIPQS